MLLLMAVTFTVLARQISVNVLKVTTPGREMGRKMLSIQQPKNALTA